MRPLRALAYAALALLALALLAAGAALVIVDGAFVKARLERMMKEKGRALRIEGTPVLRLFPVASIALGRATLSEPGSERVFVTVDSAEIALRVLPLLSGEIALETLKLAGLAVNLVRGKDGRMNFADLAAPVRPEGERDRAPLRLRVGEVRIERAQLRYRDEASGQEIAVSELALLTGRLDGAAPAPVSATVRMSGKNPALELVAHASGALRLDPAREAFAFGDFRAGAKGRIGAEMLVAEFSAPKIDITPARAVGAEAKGTVQLKGPQRALDARLRVEGISGSARALSAAVLALDLDASAGANAIQGRISTPVNANLVARSWELPEIAGTVTIASPEIAQRRFAAAIRASAKADLARGSAALDLAAKFDGSNLQAKLAAAKLEPLSATFEVVADRLDLDRYLAPADSKSKKDERVDFSALKGPTLSGKLEVGALTVRRLKLQNVEAEVRLANGRLEVAPHSARLYGGSLAGSLVADASANRIELKETIRNVALGPLLRDAAQRDAIEGRGDLTLDLRSAGGTLSALRKALAGTARFELKDGAVKGVNLADIARNVKSALGAKQTKADPSQKTDFSELSASFAIRDGVARNDDLKGASPFLRLAGAGVLDIGANAIDYQAKATLVATPQGQGGRDAKDLAGVTIPIRFTGALDNPSWSVDYSALAAGAGGAIGRAAGGAADAARRGAGALGDAVRGILRR